MMNEIDSNLTSTPFFLKSSNLVTWFIREKRDFSEERKGARCCGSEPRSPSPRGNQNIWILKMCWGIEFEVGHGLWHIHFQISFFILAPFGSPKNQRNPNKTIWVSVATVVLRIPSEGGASYGFDGSHPKSVSELKGQLDGHSTFLYFIGMSSFVDLVFCIIFYPLYKFRVFFFEKKWW